MYSINQDYTIVYGGGDYTIVGGERDAMLRTLDILLWLQKEKTKNKQAFLHL